MAQELLDLTGNPWQREFVFSPHKYTGYYGGIRNGKSFGGCYRALYLSQQFPGNVGLVGRLTYPELWDTTEKIFLDFVRKLNGGTLEPGPYVKEFNQTKNFLRLYNDSIIYFRYLQNIEAILSMTLGWFYVDQAEFITEEVYEHLEGRLSLWSPDRKRECAEAYERLHKEPLPYEPSEYGFITGNPAPGWVYRRYKRGLNREGKPIEPNPYHMIEATTEANIKNLPEDYLASLTATQTADWVARYLMGDWTTFAGQIYKDYQESLHVVPLMTLPAHWPRFLGWDHGTENPTAVLFVCVDEDGNCVVYNEHYKVSPVIRDHAEAVQALCIGDPVERTPDGKGVVVWMDSAISGDHDPEGRDFKQLYQELGIFGLNANKQVNAGIQKVSLLLHPDPTHEFPKWHPRGEKRDKAGKVIKEAEKGAPRLYFMQGRCPATMHEIVMYEWEPVPEGSKMNAKERPRKYMDHAMDALRYVLMAVFEKAKPLEKKRDVTYQEFVNAEVLGVNKRIKDEVGEVDEVDAIWE